ncbi:MAG: CehA/McbA family metallohydrolase [candidate division KSB1 bacterium]|nr:CehA/McbA family metallohydrolase [candidate division KSB1 bacterium]MDZ7366006.1 CehA/McbA family metallohydrolase [candidate division KSB1 bacterium]MDZ7404123.1 CehA/McbA family metallohydrolase [candidate division KSB1 bacterium]
MGNEVLPDFPFLFSRVFFFIPLWLYAEIHYRFKFIPSRLFYRQPEIIADAPHRIAPGQPLPVLLLVKDANRFPIELQAITAYIRPDPQTHQPNPRVLRFTLFDSPEQINSPLWWRTFFIAMSDDFRGAIAHLNVEIIYRCGSRQLRCYNDNHAGTSHAPLRVYLADAPLPGFPNFWHGELHGHTDATSDQVEFGAPLEAMVELAKAQGLNFFAATDHSYDLDDLPDNYLQNDPLLRKWHHLRERIKRCNALHQDFVIIPGEEVSAGNSQRRNVHVLVFNSPQFFPGSGDSAERWLRTAPEMAIGDILAQLGDEALAFAAHPEAPAPFLERLLLRRGKWETPDYQHPRLNGLQIWNGAPAGMQEGAARWRELLLAGRKLFIIAGNDAHGNFNRFRQVGIPHLKMREHHRHLFGRTRTAVISGDQLNLPSLMSALRNGRACITTGPMIDLQIFCTNSVCSNPFKGPAPAGATTNRLIVRAISSQEFGKLTRLVVRLGDLQTRQERPLFETHDFADPFLFSHEQPLDLPAGNYYLRGEVHSAGSEFLPERALPCCALTNPIWIESKS